MNNHFSIFTQSDLNRIWKETIKKTIGLITLTGEFMCEHEAVWVDVQKLDLYNILSSNMANDSFNLFVSIFVSFSIDGLKENAKNLNYNCTAQFWEEKWSFICFYQLTAVSMRKFSCRFFYNQGEHCLSAVFFALLTCWHIQSFKIFAFLFSRSRNHKTVTELPHFPL